MPWIFIESGELRAAIVPSIGAAVAGLWRRCPAASWEPLLRCARPDATWFNDMACYLLAPWSNRIAGACFDWHGKRIQLTPDWPDGTAIHGLVKDKPWRLSQRSPASVSLVFDSRDHPLGAFPWPFLAEVCYALHGPTFSAMLALTHLPDGSEPAPMPVGLGFHPFFPRSPGSGADHIRIRYAPHGRYPAQGMIPTAPPRADRVCTHLEAGEPLDDLLLDDVFLGSSDGATITWPAAGVSLRFSCSAGLGHTVLYTGSQSPAPAICLEPVSMVNDGFNLLASGWPDTGVRSLAPGERMEAAWSFTVEHT